MRLDEQTSIRPMAFDFESSAVRIVMRDGEPWFAGKDVCGALEITDHKQALARLDPDERGGYIVPPPTAGARSGGAQEMVIISEPGVYRLVFTSRTEAAERFKRWLAHDVLPALRRTGVYVAPGETLSDERLPMDADQKVWGVAVAKLNAAGRMLSNAARLYGTEAARRLWEADPTLPSLRRFELSAIIGTAEDDPVGCIDHLMRYAVHRDKTVGDMLRLGLVDKVMRKEMANCGILIDPSGGGGQVAVATRHPFLSEVYARTQWRNEWRHAFMKLTGAKLYAGRKNFGGEISGAVFVPKETIADAITRAAPIAPPPA